LGLGRERETTDATLTKEIAIADRNVNVTIFEKVTDERGRTRNAKIAEFEFVVAQSPFVTFSTLSLDYDGQFGFDDGEDFRDNSVPKQRGQYETIQVVSGRRNQTETLYVPWLTLTQGQTAELQVNLSREIDGDVISVVPDAGITARYNQQQRRLFITSISLDNDFNNPAYINFYRTDQYGLQTDMLIGRIAVVSRPRFRQTIDVQIVYFASDTTNFRNTVDKARLQAMLNSNSMNQAFVQFNVRPNAMPIQYTLSGAAASDHNAAYRAISRILPREGILFTTNEIQPPTIIYVVMTDLQFTRPANEGGGERGGGVLDNSNLVAVWTVNDRIAIANRERIIIHEIGHSLGLSDAFNDEALGRQSEGFSRSNYMDYGFPKNMFFRTQIESIINSLRRRER
jgi:hypothetical protein